MSRILKSQHIAGSRPNDQRQNLFMRWFTGSHVVDHRALPKVVYHGTNQDIHEFSTCRLGQNTGSTSSRSGFYFTEDPVEAAEYAQMSARRQVSNALEREANAERLLNAMEQAERRGDHDAAERLYLELEASEEEAITGDERGANIVPVFLSVKKPAVIDMHDSVDLYGMSEVIAKARNDGHDGVKLLNVYDPVGIRPQAFTTTQWVVFEPHQVVSALTLVIPRRLSADFVPSDALHQDFVR